jgi:hypothetical protein|tara:strand:- start:2720 stop:2929 length:210 start_codon:yes stop_codon:yes gene_type:complete
MMASSDFTGDLLVDKFKKKLRELLNVKADNVATGSCASFDEYKHQAGVIEGLALAEREFLDIIEELERL